MIQSVETRVDKTVSFRLDVIREACSSDSLHMFRHMSHNNSAAPGKCISNYLLLLAPFTILLQL